MKPRKGWRWCDGGGTLLEVKDVNMGPKGLNDLDNIRSKARKTRCNVCNRRLMPHIGFPSPITDDIVCVRIPPHKSRK